MELGTTTQLRRIDMAYYTTNYFANVKGYTKVKLAYAAETSSWADGEIVRIGSPNGTPFTFRVSSTLYTDDQPTQTMVSDIAPTTSGAFPRSHPKVGKGAYTNNSQGGDAFGSYVVGDSPSIVGQNRDTIPAAGEFYILDSNLTGILTPGSKIYNTNNPGGGEAVNLTKSWREIPNTAITGTGVGHAFVSVTSSNEEKILIYAFGGEETIGNYDNYIFVCTASTDATGLQLDISPWYRQDDNKNLWPGSNSAVAFPNPGSSPLIIPSVVGVSDGAAAVDTATNTIYFGGGKRQQFISSTDIIYGSTNIYGWSYDPVTGLLTGSAFNAGVMPMGRMGHEMFVANGFLYCIGGLTASYPNGFVSQVTESYHTHIDRALIRNDGMLTDWATCAYEIPAGVNVIGTGTGIVEGAAFIYPNDATSEEKRYVHLVCGLKQYYNGSAYVTRSSAQGWHAQLNYTGSAALLPNQNKIGVDETWMGPSAGEQLTVGAQLGPPDIKPVLPLLEDIYQQLVDSTTPARALPEGKTLVGYRPGLRGTEIFGLWQFRIATSPGAFNPNGFLPDGTNNGTAGWGALTSSQVYIRQLRIEFLVDATSGYSDMQYFNPARERLYKKSGQGFRNGKKLVDIISGSQWWDAGVSYIYAYQPQQYGRSVGITTNSSSGDYAVYTQLTGALATHLTGTPDWFLNPPNGEGVSGLPYIPISSAAYGEASQPFTYVSASDMFAATVDQQLPNPSDNTLPAYLSRIRALRTTQQLFEDQLRNSNSGSYF
jgi:hypothetical protein